MLITLLGCENPPATWYYGEDLRALEVSPVDWDEGVHPSTAVLDDPANPFVDGVDAALKWELLAADCAPGFYAFATALAYEPTGEHQFYSAHCLHTLYAYRSTIENFEF